MMSPADALHDLEGAVLAEGAGLTLEQANQIDRSLVSLTTANPSVCAPTAILNRKGSPWEQMGRAWLKNYMLQK